MGVWGGGDSSREQTEGEEMGRRVAVGKEMEGRGGRSLVTQPESHSMSTSRKVESKKT